MSNLVIEKIPDDYLDLDNYIFWEKIYNENLHPLPGCSTCHEKIDDASQWVSFTCDCNNYYHKQCIFQTFESLTCPNCNCQQIYAFPKFLCKFMKPERYYKIYEMCIRGKDSATKLKLYKLWFRTFSIYTPPFLDLYEYLEPHNPINTINFLESKKNTHQIECFDPAFIVEDDGMTYDTKRIKYYGEKVFVDLTKFRERLQEYCYNLIDENFPYQDHVVLAGGAVHKCLESRIEMEDIPKYANIDIFICHQDIKIVMRDTKRIIRYFQDLHGENIFWIRKNSNVIRLYVPGYNRAVQIIFFRNRLEDIISKFDFSHIQYVYNGKTILTTLAGLEYANYLVSVHHGCYDIHFAKRFFKAKQLKLCLALPMAESMTLNLPKELNIGVWYPTYTDDLAIVQTQMKNVFGIKNTYVTQGKPCRILYSKIPEEFHQDRFSNSSSILDDEIISYIEQETATSTYSN